MLDIGIDVFVRVKHDRDSLLKRTYNNDIGLSLVRPEQHCLLERQGQIIFSSPRATVRRPHEKTDQQALDAIQLTHEQTENFAEAHSTHGKQVHLGPPAGLYLNYLDQT